MYAITILYIIVGNLLLSQITPELSLFYFPFITTGKIVGVDVCSNSIQLCETIEYIESEYFEKNTCISPIPFGGKNEDLYTMYLEDKTKYLDKRPNKVHILVKKDECAIVKYDYSSMKYKVFILLVFSLCGSYFIGVLIHLSIMAFYYFVTGYVKPKPKDKLEEIEFYV